MKIKISGLAFGALAAWLVGFQTLAYHEIAGGPIIVNGQEIRAADGAALMQLYGPIPAGEYWYDSFSGLWGLLGGPGTGQILPHLDIGGELRANASGGDTGVFVNGREIHSVELARLQQLYGAVEPGRYWMNAGLIGGFEGGPAFFNLNTASSNQQGSGYNRNTIGGGLMSDGNCSGYLHPGGATVMTGNC